MKENNEKKIKNEHEISKLIKAFPKDIAETEEDCREKNKDRKCERDKC